MIEDWRQFLYPLGLISGIAFSSRFLLQWIGSEKAQKSIVTGLFWKISLFGNLALLIHAFIQLQFHICFVQVCNAVISWRNIDLMHSTHNRWKLSSVIVLLIVAIITVTSAFWLQVHYLHDSTSWLRTPKSIWSSSEYVRITWLWHGIGILGLFLFNSRFWVQWWGAERKGQSYLGPAFWWMSLFGAFFCMAYFIKIADWVNLLGPMLGIIPTVRNLMILRKQAVLN